MATVLNRISLELLRSVNTPDYPEEEWIINPDLSAVEGVDRKYWKIDVDTVLPMDEAEQAAYDLAHPIVVIRNHLLDGTPCFMYDGMAISTQKDVKIFTGATSSAGAKNFALTSMLMAKVYIPGNSIIKAAQIVGQSLADTTFRVSAVKSGSPTEVRNLVLAAQTQVSDYPKIDMMIEGGSMLDVLVSGTKPIVNPVCILEIHRRD